MLLTFTLDGQAISKLSQESLGSAVHNCAGSGEESSLSNRTREYYIFWV